MNRAIIVAAGSSARMNGTNKILAEISGIPLIVHTLEKFQHCDDIDSITIVSQKHLYNDIEKIKDHFKITKIKNIIAGGRERQDSVFNGLNSLENCNDNDIIVVHNGSNPLVKIGEISACITAARKHGAAVLAFPLKDTIKKVKDGLVESTLDRNNIWQMQTPQCVQYGIFKDAFANAKMKKMVATDDVAMVEAIGRKVKIVPCSTRNFKITTPEDLEMARKIMGKNVSATTLIGLGLDSHRFSEKKKPLVIGGYTIPGERGLEANSDGDIVLHALFNAISSALGGRSLGITADKMFGRGITDSREYLMPLLDSMEKLNFSIGNVSVSIEAKKPRLEQHHDNIKESLCNILGISKNQVGITFTSGEGLTGFGRGEGMQCFCVVNFRWK